jgi:hypothetical protein
MAINVGLISEPSTLKELNNYSYYTFQGLTSTSDSFLQDLDEKGASAWYVFDPSVTAYVPFGEDVLSLFTDSSSITSESVSIFFQNVRFLINSTAVSYGYDSADNFISYYNSGITAWRDEAIAFNTWRDNTLSLMYDNIFSFTADGITLPNLSGFTAQVGYFDVGVTASRPNLFS